jgi:predicted RNA-binding Zn-ribbon protein involved in translation (DUF1610 family)
MDVKVVKKNNKDIKIYSHRKIEIQCPNCGELFIFNELGECFCTRCNRLFSDNEVRARCGL